MRLTNTSSPWITIPVRVDHAKKPGEADITSPGFYKSPEKTISTITGKSNAKKNWPVALFHSPANECGIRLRGREY